MAHLNHFCVLNDGAHINAPRAIGIWRLIRLTTPSVSRGWMGVPGKMLVKYV